MADTYAEVGQLVEASCHDRLAEEGQLTARAEAAVLASVVQGMLADLNEQDELAYLDAAEVARWARANRRVIDAHIDDELVGFNLTAANRRLLHELIVPSICRSVYSAGHSGVVIAGFGADDIFPALTELTTDGFMFGELKHERSEFPDADDGSDTVILPFAQSEMVQRFMEGVDQEFLDYLRSSVEELVIDVGRAVLNARGLRLAGRFKSALEQFASWQTGQFLEHASAFRGEYFTQPILDVLRYLPKEELGGMAEALVSLTSLKHRVSPDLETVAGPVDVALISKGDGFTWVKRKHGVDAFLNPHYGLRHSKA